MIKSKLGALARAVNIYRTSRVLEPVSSTLPEHLALRTIPVLLDPEDGRHTPLRSEKPGVVGDSGNEYVPVKNGGLNPGQTGDNHGPVDINRSVARSS